MSSNALSDRSLTDGRHRNGNNRVTYAVEARPRRFPAMESHSGQLNSSQPNFSEPSNPTPSHKRSSHNGVITPKVRSLRKGMPVVTTSAYHYHGDCHETARYHSQHSTPERTGQRTHPGRNPAHLNGESPVSDDHGTVSDCPPQHPYDNPVVRGTQRHLGSPFDGSRRRSRQAVIRSPSPPPSYTLRTPKIPRTVASGVKRGPSQLGTFDYGENKRARIHGTQSQLPPDSTPFRTSRRTESVDLTGDDDDDGFVNHHTKQRSGLLVRHPINGTLESLQGQDEHSTEANQGVGARQSRHRHIERSKSLNGVIPLDTEPYNGVTVKDGELLYNGDPTGLDGYDVQSPPLFVSQQTPTTRRRLSYSQQPGLPASSMPAHVGRSHLQHRPERPQHKLVESGRVVTAATALEYRAKPASTSLRGQNAMVQPNKGPFPEGDSSDESETTPELDRSRLTTIRQKASSRHARPDSRREVRIEETPITQARRASLTARSMHHPPDVPKTPPERIDISDDISSDDDESESAIEGKMLEAMVARAQARNREMTKRTTPTISQRPHQAPDQQQPIVAAVQQGDPAVLYVSRSDDSHDTILGSPKTLQDGAKLGFQQQAIPSDQASSRAIAQHDKRKSTVKDLHHNLERVTTLVPNSPDPLGQDRRPSHIPQVTFQELEDVELLEERRRERELEAHIAAQQARIDAGNAKAARIAASRDRQAALQEQLAAKIEAYEKQKSEQVAEGQSTRERQEAEKQKPDHERSKADQKAVTERRKRQENETSIHNATADKTRKTNLKDREPDTSTRSAAAPKAQKPSVVDKAVAKLTGKTAQAEQEARVASRKSTAGKVAAPATSHGNAAQTKKRGRPAKARPDQQFNDSKEKAANVGKKLEAESKAKKQTVPNDVQKTPDASTTIAAVTDEDLYLVQQRDAGNTWKKVGTLWTQKTGKRLSESTLQSRYKKAKASLKQPCDSSEIPPEVRSRPGSGQTQGPVHEPEAPSATTPQLSSGGSRKGLVDYDDDLDSGEDDPPPQKSNPTTSALVVTDFDHTEGTVTDSASVLVAGSRPSIGGKTYNTEALQAYLASLDDDVSEAEEPSERDEPDEHESDVEEVQREESLVADGDACHWEYQIKRKTWLTDEDEDDVQWFVCGNLSYSSLLQANAAAGQEILKEREGLALGPSVRKWSHELDENDMAQYYAMTPEGHIKVVVDRFLRSPTEGKWPTSKLGWIKKQAYLVWQRTKTKTTKPDGHDELFEEPTEPTETVTVELLDGCYTILDEANREAGRLVLAMTTNAKSQRMDDQLKRAEAQKRMRERLDELEGRKEAFREEVKLSGERTVELWVEMRELKGPRNI